MHRFLPLSSLLLFGCPVETQPTDTDEDTEVQWQEATLRVVTWNIQGVGRSTSNEFAAAVQVLRRLDADVVGLNEVEGDELTAVVELATAAGYDHVFVPDDNPYGDLRNAILSKHAFGAVDAPTSAVLSGESRATDVTRLPVTATVQLPSNPHVVYFVVQHWKSGFSISDRFRRAADGYRTASASVRDSHAHVFAMGDVNAELDEMPESPDPFSYKPTDDDMPWAWTAGPDLQEELDGNGLRNNAFHYLREADIEPLDAVQLDGRDGTRPASGKRIDYIFASVALRALQPKTEVYDCTDEGQGNALPKTGEAPPRQACQDASDHLPVIAEVVLPAT